MIAFETLCAEAIERNFDLFAAIASDLPEMSWSLEQFCRDLPEKWTLSFAAWESERPVAYAVLSRKSPDTIHLHRLIVARTHRNRGLGRKMLTEMTARARRAGGRYLTLKVAAENRNAQDFYGAYGFRISGRDGSYRVMCYELASHEPKR